MRKLVDAFSHQLNVKHLRRAGVECEFVINSKIFHKTCAHRNKTLSIPIIHKRQKTKDFPHTYNRLFKILRPWQIWFIAKRTANGGMRRLFIHRHWRAFHVRERETIWQTGSKLLSNANAKTQNEKWLPRNAAPGENIFYSYDNVDKEPNPPKFE